MSFTCGLCGGASYKKLPYYYILNGKRIQGVRCLSCGLTTVHPKPSKEVISSLYDGAYFKSDYHCGHREGSYEEEAINPEQIEALRRLKTLSPPGKLLEIGAAGGKFLIEARAAGYEVKGVEISADACGQARGLGVDVFCGELSDAKLPEGMFQAAYMGDVLEHLHSPLSEVREVFRVLSKGGVLCISCPTNIGLLSSRIGLFIYGLLGRERVSPIPPYHLYEFMPGQIRQLLEKAGFKVIRVERRIIEPWKIILRGSIIEKAGKLLFHWPNYVITSLTGRMGDRVTIFAKKP
jgi:SAM-dependent methyltransferase